MNAPVSLDQFCKSASSDAGRTLFPWQCRLALKPWPDLLKIPTGLGKTAGVGLAWMHKRCQGDPETPRRLVWCLPMRTLVEQTAASVSTWLANLRNAGLDPEQRLPEKPHVLMGGEVDDTWIRHPEKPAILIGTQDILISRALMRGYGVSRGRWPVDFALLHNDAMWVFDEIQLMAAGAPTSAQLEAFRRAIGTMAGSRSLWMSATLEREWLGTVDFKDASSLEIRELDDDDRKLAEVRKRLDAPKTLTRAERSITAAATTAKGEGQYADALADDILRRHQAGKTTLVIVNRVGRAQALFDALDGKRGSIPLVLVHSRFRPAERSEINKRLVELPGEKGRIVVATQAVEAGVDITSAVMFTELAPWASLVQRFGRLNRGGEEKDAQAVWIDIQTDDSKATELARPYEPEELDAARTRLSQLAEVSPQTLEPLGSEFRGSWQVLRRKDLYDLFDTDSDLTGFDVDVSSYVRGADDTDVRVFWREIADLTENARKHVGHPHRDEICAVPLGQANHWLTKRSGAFVWDWVDSEWVRLDRMERLWPGALVLVDAALGGYDETRGFDPGAKLPVSVVVRDAGKARSDRSFDEDADTLKDRKVPLPDHLIHARDEAAQLATALRLPDAETRAIVKGSLWHDLGKAHDTFKARCWLKPEDPPLAKTPNYDWRREDPRNRRHFRHELASALAWLQHGPRDELHDLIAYLIATHHGKVRMGLRALPGEQRPDDPTARFARGVWDGDRLPAFSADGLSIPDTKLALDVMELGGGSTGRSWAARTHELLHRYGPFRLAFLEAILRIADWRASEAEQRDGGGKGDGGA